VTDFKTGGARWRGVLAVVGLTVGISACGAVLEGPQAVQDLVDRPAMTSVDLALGAMARGEYGAAERYFMAAIERPAPDPYALFGVAALYENTGRPQQAIEAYERLLALQPQGTVSTGPWADLHPVPLRDAARANLRALRQTMRGQTHAHASARVGRAPNRSPAPAALDLPLGVAAPDDGGPGVWGAAPPAEAAQAQAAAQRLDPAAARFVLLRRLRDEGLITGTEYQARRTANLGALLPMTHKAPAEGLTRPAPDSDAVVSRLHQLRAAFERRAITARQHAAERDIILDALLPAAPETRAPEARLPKDVMAAAEALGRLERLREARLITAGEYRKERKTLKDALRKAGRLPGQGTAKLAAKAPAPAPPRPAEKPAMLVPPQGAAPGGARNPAATLKGAQGPVQIVPDPPSFAAGEVPAPEEGGGGIAAVHLASFKSEKAALEGWARLQAANPVLRGLEPRITVIRLPGKGTFHRLNAGPVKSRAAAQKVCEDLGDQYCEPVFLGG